MTYVRHVFLFSLLPVLLVPLSAEPDTKSPDAPPPESAPATGPYTELSNSIAAYERVVGRIQSESGAFDARLVEPLTSIGMTQMVAGDHAAAARSFERAQHITRVTEGLYSMSQVPLIELQIENNTAWDKTEELDRNYQQLYWVFRRNHGPEDLALVGIIEKIASRRLSAFHAAPVSRYLGQALHADILYDSAIGILQKHPEERATLSRAFYRQALANYFIASTADDTSQSLYDLRRAMAEAGRGPYDVDGFEARGEMFRDSYFKGTVTLDRLVNLAAEDPRNYVARAEALLFAGDYFFTFRRNWDAMRRYEEAWKLLQENNARPEEVQRLFGEPRRIEPIEIPGEEQPPPNERKHWVDASFDVSDSGWPENIRIIATHPENDEALATQGRLAVAGVRHRPRFENGRPVVARDVSIRYVFKNY
ncbi:MAG: hypothetical protein HYY48_02075 [Gammaproteobacteria bacterium]|nr:hypothetical protein [Gammaproteobacteria bacterium]